MAHLSSSPFLLPRTFSCEHTTRHGAWPLDLYQVDMPLPTHTTAARSSLRCPRPYPKPATCSLPHLSLGPFSSSSLGQVEPSLRRRRYHSSIPHPSTLHTSPSTIAATFPNHSDRYWTGIESAAPAAIGISHEASTAHRSPPSGPSPPKPTPW